MKEFPQLPTEQELRESVRMTYYWRDVVKAKDLGDMTLAKTTDALRDAGLLRFLPDDTVRGISEPKLVTDSIRGSWQNVLNRACPDRCISSIQTFLRDRFDSVQGLASLLVGSNVKKTSLVEAIGDPDIDLIKLPLFSGESFMGSSAICVGETVPSDSVTS
jgi:hypothetical protein